MTENRKDTTSRRTAFALTVLAALAVIAGCEMPHKAGLMSTFGTDGVHDQTTLDLTELPDRPTLADGSVPFAATWCAGEGGEFRFGL
ncbi:MAG: hypothetical protein ACOCVO_02030 [bacterium]